MRWILLLCLGLCLASNLQADELAWDGPRLQAGPLVTVTGEAPTDGDLFVNGKEARIRFSRFHIELLLGEGCQLLHYETRKNGVVSTAGTWPICVLKSFADIQGHWAEQDIQLMATYYDLGGRYGANNFYPDEPLSRLDCMWILAVVFNWDLIRPSHPRFTDVGPMNWAYPYVETALKRYPTLFDGETFLPDAWVNRQWVSHVLVSEAGFSQSEIEAPLAADLMSSLWAYEDIQTGLSTALFPKQWEHRWFFPYKTVTRAEFMALLVRVPRVRDELSAAFSTQIQRESWVVSAQSAPAPGSSPAESILAVDLIRQEQWGRPVWLMKVRAESKLDSIAVIQEDPESESPLFDTGRWGDGVANDLLYTGILPRQGSQFPDALRYKVGDGSRTRHLDCKERLSEQGRFDCTLVSAAFVGTVHLDNSESQHPVPDTQLDLSLAVNEGQKLFKRSARWGKEYMDFLKSKLAELSAEKEAEQESKIAQAVAKPAAAPPPAVSTPASTEWVFPDPDDAPSAAEKADAQEYTVVPGDTLAKIARRWTGSGRNWKLIASFNQLPLKKEVIHEKVYWVAPIRVGQTLWIPALD